MYPDKPLNDNRLIVANDITFNFRGEIIDMATVEKWYEHWRGCAVISGIGKRWLTKEADREAFLSCLYERVPLTLETLTNTQFRADFKHIPYQINGEEAYCSYALHLVPISGGISKLVMHATGLAVNSLSQEPMQMKADLGNGSLHLEVYFAPEAKMK